LLISSLLLKEIAICVILFNRLSSLDKAICSLLVLIGGQLCVEEIFAEEVPELLSVNISVMIVVEELVFSDIEVVNTEETWMLKPGHSNRLEDT
jgi:predicted tellurium resistance membrane protein TerC